MLTEEPAVRVYTTEFIQRARANNRRRERERKRAEREAHLAMLAEEAAKARKEILARKAEGRAALEEARRLLMSGELSIPTRTKMERIEHRALRVFNVTRAELKGEGKNELVVFARQFVMYWTRRLCQQSYQQIATRVGRADHTSAHHGVRAYVSKRAAMKRNLRPAR
jgi:chromosomal replication initiation ATPase DnaA